MSCSDHERSEEAKPELTDPVFLQHAEAHVGPWWEARIRDLMKQVNKHGEVVLALRGHDQVLGAGPSRGEIDEPVLEAGGFALYRGDRAVDVKLEGLRARPDKHFSNPVNYRAVLTYLTQGG